MSVDSPASGVKGDTGRAPAAAVGSLVEPVFAPPAQRTGVVEIAIDFAAGDAEPLGGVQAGVCGLVVGDDLDGDGEENIVITAEQVGWSAGGGFEGFAPAAGLLIALRARRRVLRPAGSGDHGQCQNEKRNRLHSCSNFNNYRQRNIFIG